MTVKVTKPALNLREELSSLKKPSGVAGEAMLRAETPQEQFTLIGAGRKNLIINGDMRISQRGDFTSGTTDEAYILDRWETDAYITGNTTTYHTSPSYPYANSFATKVVANADNNDYIRSIQRVESINLIEGATYTFSAYVKSNHAQARLLNISSGSWASNDTTAKHSGNGQWERLTQTFTHTNGYTNPHFTVAIATSSHGRTDVIAGDYIEFTNVQLELGSVATPFEHRSYGEELALCQRYCYAYGNGSSNYSQYGYIRSSTVGRAFTKFPVTMRATPTLVSGGTSAVFVISNYTSYDSSTASASLSLVSANTESALLGTTGSYSFPTNSPAALDGLYFVLDAEL